ncbi:glycosyltransferase [Paenibacillus silagei]|uniref:GT2 family glycosyltransferase/glycosyltransferase involved in cell wall biosynthesis n=1 Tax=Paenibacillus silagei TaxID=1670801 RepID=A0ABS4NIM1_9BACL|nr:glycosyltransferase [Paenibacillus silagei]MBP2109886.1 GT2 family glycosyltransferase/glycosyltransferase involved in cell wall biosynthesis [Paenibacillus silagei]
MGIIPQEIEEMESELQNSKIANEINMKTIKTLKNQLSLLESTKAWKLMCLLRRVNEQFLKGDRTEKRKFISWVQKKITKKAIPIEYSLSKFSPIQSEKIEMYEIKEKKKASNSSKYTSELKYEGSFITFDVPKSYDIFRFPVINWDFRWQRPQQLSVQFAESGHRVFYLSVDIIPLLKGNLTYEEVSKEITVIEVRKNVWTVQICSKNPINVYRDRIEDLDDLLYLGWCLEYIQEKFDIGFTVSIVDLPFWKPLIDGIPLNKVVYDCMDDHEGFSTNSKSMLTDEKQLMVKADLVIASSQRLYEKISIENDNTVLIRNAGEYTHFSDETKILTERLAPSGSVIGYYGAISEWFDIDLICSLAKKNKDWTFILIGDTFGCDTTRADNISNVKFLGEMPYHELPKYLNQFDVALIPFVKNNLTLATNPVKIYEYLAAGKPVVSTDLPELKLMSDYLYLANTHEDFERSILLALKETNDRTVEKRKKYALDNTWNSRYKSLNEEMQTRFFPKVSIVIVTYNNWTYTKQCLNSLLLNNDYPNLEVIVVDNLSTDETRIELARLMHPHLKIVLSPENTGFAGGNTIGCKEATGEFIILLNNDTIVSPGWIHRLIRPMKMDSTIGMAGPVSNSVGNDQMLDFFQGDPINGADRLWLSEFYELYDQQYYETDLLGFYCVAIQRDVYDRLGGLDLNYGIGMFEDDDFCEQVKTLGYKLVVVQDAFVYHHGSASFKKIDSVKYNEVWETNKGYFESKWNRQWEYPKNPRTIFFNCFDNKSVGVVMKNLKKSSVLILGDSNWSSKRAVNGAESLAKTMASDGKMVIVYVHTYNSVAFAGVRKLSDDIYITNRLDLFDNIKFNSIIYAGQLEYHKLSSDNEYVFLSAYSPNQLVSGMEVAGLEPLLDKQVVLQQ